MSRCCAGFQHPATLCWLLGGEVDAVVAAWMKHAKGRQLTVEDLQASAETSLQFCKLKSIACSHIEVNAYR